MKGMVLLVLFTILFSSTYAQKNITVEEWIKELEKARDPDLKPDYDLLDSGYEKLQGKLLKPLEELLKSTPQGRVMAKGLNYVKDLGRDGHNVIPLIQICLKDTSDGARKKALQILRSVYNKGPNKDHYQELYPQLAHILLNDWRSDLRTISAQTIERLKAKEFVYALILGLQEHNKNAKGQIYKALKKIAKPDKLLFITQVNEWKAWFEENKDKFPPQIIPPAPKMIEENPDDMEVDISTPQKTLASFAACAEKGNTKGLGKLWSKKDGKHSVGTPDEDEKKESARNSKLYYGTMLPLYQRLGNRFVKEKPKNLSDEKDKAIFELEQKHRLDRVRKVILLKEYQAVEIFIKSGGSKDEIQAAIAKCQENLDEIQLLATSPEEFQTVFESKAKELAEKGKDQKRHLVKYFILKEFDNNIKSWFLKAKKNEISPVFARERGASCFLFLGRGWRFSTFEPHFTE